MLITMIASGPDDPHHPIQASLEFCLVEIGDAPRQHVGNWPEFLAQSKRPHRHRRQRLGRGQSVRELAAAAHAVDNIGP